MKWLNNNQEKNSKRSQATAIVSTKEHPNPHTAAPPKRREDKQ